MISARTRGPPAYRPDQTGSKVSHWPSQSRIRRLFSRHLTVNHDTQQQHPPRRARLATVAHDHQHARQLPVLDRRVGELAPDLSIQIGC